ncbi:MAG: hypothetical protein AAF950_08530 [Pseudomonadota bacterium]
MIRLCLMLLTFFAFGLSGQAGEADVLSATIRLDAGGTYTISVEVEHADDGWDHYADAWEVLAPDRTLIARRVLAHPHVNEQPFIRSLSGIEIPDGVDLVTLRARDLVHGYGGKEMTLEVPSK